MALWDYSYFIVSETWFRRYVSLLRSSACKLVFKTPVINAPYISVGFWPRIPRVHWERTVDVAVSLTTGYCDSFTEAVQPKAPRLIICGTDLQLPCIVTDHVRRKAWIVCQTQLYEISRREAVAIAEGFSNQVLFLEKAWDPSEPRLTRTFPMTVIPNKVAIERLSKLGLIQILGTSFLFRGEAFDAKLTVHNGML